MINLNEDFYKKLLDNLFDAVYFVELHRKITYWNKSAESLTGYKGSEITVFPSNRWVSSSR